MSKQSVRIFEEMPLIHFKPTKIMTEQNALVSKELSAAGVPSEITPELIELDHYRITSDSNLPEEEFMMELFGKKCFPRKDLTTFTGPAKSGKTFWTSILMACCAKAADSERKVLELQRIREEPLKVMWYDTEQSRQTTKNILANRIFKMSDTDGQEAELNQLFYVFNVRSLTCQERVEMLPIAIKAYRPDIVIIDGIADLLHDINDGPKATELIEQLLQLADEFNCNITTIIHLNRTGEKSNLRGWIGTVMLQKSFEVFVCEKLYGSSVMSVEMSTSRRSYLDKKLYYQVDALGIPYAIAKPDIQPRNEKGQFMSKDADKDKSDNFNHEYLIDNPRSEQGWEWNLQKLFADAMAGKAMAGSDDMMAAVQRLSNIRQKQYYYKVLSEAERKGIVKKTYDRNGRIAIVMPPR